MIDLTQAIPMVTQAGTTQHVKSGFADHHTFFSLKLMTKYTINNVMYFFNAFYNSSHKKSFVDQVPIVQS